MSGSPSGCDALIPSSSCPSRTSTVLDYNSQAGVNTYLATVAAANPSAAAILCKTCDWIAYCGPCTSTTGGATSYTEGVYINSAPVSVSVER